MSIMRYVCSFLILPAILGFAPTHFRPKTDADMFKVSVAITNMAGTAGGSGVILHSDNTGSVIMTNKHVCALGDPTLLVDPPGHVKSTASVLKIDSEHDLCLVKVGVDYHISIQVSKKGAEPGDEAIIVGHPALLPTIVTHGHFSEHMPLPISKEDGSVVIEEAQVVSATIMPGSSGSPVFNHRGELSGIVFAGGGGLSYAFIVPVEFIWSFLLSD